MIFKTLSMNNIRSYKNNPPIKFPVGTSLFEGDIGSGKSTILMAIEFALFGLGNQKGDSLLRKGSKKGKVTLEFKIENDNYLVPLSWVRREYCARVTREKPLRGKRGANSLIPPSEWKEKFLVFPIFKDPLIPGLKAGFLGTLIIPPQGVRNWSPPKTQ